MLKHGNAAHSPAHMSPTKTFPSLSPQKTSQQSLHSVAFGRLKFSAPSLVCNFCTKKLEAAESLWGDHAHWACLGICSCPRPVQLQTFLMPLYASFSKIVSQIKSGIIHKYSVLIHSSLSISLYSRGKKLLLFFKPPPPSPGILEGCRRKTKEDVFALALSYCA